MKKIWAPWRMEYILHVDDSVKCIFCEKKQYVLKETQHAMVMLNLFPYNPGHLMVAPKRHVANLEDLTDEELKEIMELTQKSVKVLKEIANPDGFNIGINIGRVAGAGFEGHIHIHIVPRWNGDTNFMPIIGETKVIPEGIEKTFKKLKPYFE